MALIRDNNDLNKNVITDKTSPQIVDAADAITSILETRIGLIEQDHPKVYPRSFDAYLAWRQDCLPRIRCMFLEALPKRDGFIYSIG